MVRLVVQSADSDRAAGLFSECVQLFTLLVVVSLRFIPDAFQRRLTDCECFQRVEILCLCVCLCSAFASVVPR